jgi:hypothetical protein
MPSAERTPLSPGVVDIPPASSVRRSARFAGALYLLVVAGGVFASIVQDSLTVGGDGAATAQAIAAHESLWRWGIGVHLVYLAGPALIMYVLLYRIFRPAQPTVALLALAFALVSAAVEGAALLQLYVPVALSESRSGLAAISEEQRQALAYLAIRLYQTGFGFALFFFSGFCAATGGLILRSRLVPRLIGLLMVLAGICYFVSSLATIVAPTLSGFLMPWILLPCFLGEASLAIWLLVKGIRAT